MYKVTICGVDTSLLPKMTAAQMRECMDKIKKGDKKAEQQFMNANLRLVLSIVQRFSGRASCPDDLFQVGCVGLIKAVRNFDTSHNVRFSTYAVPMIIGEIRRYLRDNTALRISRSTRDLAYRAMQEREKLILKNQREPTNEEIAAALGESLFAVEQALEAVVDPVSLSEPVYHDGNDTAFVSDIVSDPSVSEKKWAEHLALHQALTKLNEREYTIIEMRYFTGKTQMEIAQEIGISQAQVSRLEKGALDRIRKNMI